MARVSIIVPVYNCEAYLQRCVSSILGQTEKKLQLILVDDGSTDGSGAICDSFAQADSRVTVIHQKNTGVSAARNAGLDAAVGEYIGFVDADDYIAEDTYEKALSVSDCCDIVMWDVVTIWDNDRTEPDSIPLLAESCVVEKRDWSPRLLAQMAGSACRCLYRKELLEGECFPVGIKLSEDRLFNLQVMGKAEKLRYLKQGLYFRYVRADSAVHRYHGDRLEKNLLAMQKAEPIIRRYWGPEYLGVYTRMFVINGALEAIYEISGRDFPGKKRLSAIKEITSHKVLIEALRIYPPRGLREKLLKIRADLLLYGVGVLYNWKNT